MLPFLNGVPDFSMHRLLPLFAASVLALVSCSTPSIPTAGGKDAAKIAAAMRESKSLADHNRFVARVAQEVSAGQFLRYQYDRYPDVRRLKMSDGNTYASANGKHWLRSSDWGKTGTPLTAELVHECDVNAAMAELIWDDPHPKDLSQGGTVWRFVREVDHGTSKSVIYSRSRECPRPDGVYPTFTFTVWKKDNQMLLAGMTGQMHKSGRLVPVQISVDLLYRTAGGRCGGVP